MKTFIFRVFKRWSIGVNAPTITLSNSFRVILELYTWATEKKDRITGNINKYIRLHSTQQKITGQRIKHKDRKQSATNNLRRNSNEREYTRVHITHKITNKVFSCTCRNLSRFYVPLHCSAVKNEINLIFLRSLCILFTGQMNKFATQEQKRTSIWS